MKDKKNLPFIPKNQYWKRGKKVYWYLDDSHRAVWRYNVHSIEDREHKMNNNYFSNEKNCYRYFGLKEPVFTTFISDKLAKYLEEHP